MGVLLASVALMTLKRHSFKRKMKRNFNLQTFINLYFFSSITENILNAQHETKIILFMNIVSNSHLQDKILVNLLS